nr:hypothetical protein [Tanacetum cinerariifolium]
MACDEYSQEVLGFSNVVASGNPTPYYDPIVFTSSLTLTPFGDSDFLLEEVDAFLSLEDDPTLPKVDHSYFNTEGDILLLKAFLNDDPSLPPPTQGKQVEVSNRGLKRIVERTVGENHASCSNKLDDALWAFRIAFKTPIGCTPYKLVYGKACHLPIELEHKAYWPLKHENFNLQTAGDHRKVQLNELNELRDQAYENSLIYKEKTKRTHDSKIKDRIFNVDDRVLLFNSRLKIFPDQMLERLAGNKYYCFLDGFSGYFKLLIDPKDQEKTIFTCPYEKFAYRRMPFDLCNASGTFQRCMMAIFHDMIEKTMEVFMDDFLVFGNSFGTCLSHLEKMLKWCEDTNLCLNWEKSHFMVKEGIVLANRIDVIDMACEEYSDFLLEEVDAFLALEDDPTSPKVDHSYYDTKGDILLLEEFLNDDPSLPHPNQGMYLPQSRKELKICEAKSDKSLIDEPPEVELKDLHPHLEYAFLEGDDKLPIIISKDLSVEEKAALIKVLKSHNPWVSTVHCVPKKGGFTVVENEENELIPTRLVTGWRVCLNYRKLNEATCKDHFPLPFMDQMLKRLAGNEYYCFLDGFSEKTMEVFMDDFSEKSHFMVKEGIILGHKIFKNGIEVDKVKVYVIAKPPQPTTVKGIRSFLGHAGFYRRFIQDFSKIAWPMTRLVEKDTPFFFSNECIEAF